MTVSVSYDKVYKIDNKNNIRVWWAEQENERFRTVSGILDGNLVTSEWTVCITTNEGRSNERNPVDQCTFEIQSLYNDKLTSGGYHKDIANAGVKTYFEPMLAKKWEDLKDKERIAYIASGAISQPKLDGVRCIAKSDGLYSREGKPIVAVPHIHEALNEIIAKTGIIFDGELYNHNFRDDFNKIISLVRKTKPSDLDLEESVQKVQYWIYDMFDPNNPQMNYLDRLDLIKKYIGFYKVPSFIQIVSTSIWKDQENLDITYGEYLADGFEGQMLRFNKPYEQKRSKYLLKRKEFQDAEFEIVSILEGLGNWSGHAKVVEFKLPNGETAKGGIKGERGLDSAKMLEEANEYVGGTVTLRFQNLTPDGVPRFPVAVALYKGKRDM